MRNGEWGNPDRIGKERPTQPKHTEDMSDSEMRAERIQILESDKFSGLLEDRLFNRPEVGEWSDTQTFTRPEIGLIGYYIGMGDKDGLYRYLKELIGPEVESIVRKLEG